MAKYWDDFEAVIRDKIKAVITTQAATNGVTVTAAEKRIEQMEDAPRRFPANGILVLPPTWTPLVDGPQPSNDIECDWVFPVQVYQRGFNEETLVTSIGQLAGVVMDAILNNPLLAGVAGTLAAYPIVIDPANVVQGSGSNPHLVTRIVRVKVRGVLSLA